MSMLRRDTKYKPSWKDLYDLTPEVPSISNGHMTMPIPMTLFAQNRKKLMDELKEVSPHGLAILQAAEPVRCWSTGLYVQDPFFFWAFGYEEPGAIGAIDIGFGRTYLIVQRVRRRCRMWHGKGMMTRGQLKSHYLVTEAWYMDELEAFLDFMESNNYCNEILVLENRREQLPPCIYRYSIDFNKLLPIIRCIRYRKTEIEVEVLRYTTKVLESAIIHIMKRLSPGVTDQQVRTWFIFFMTYKSDFEQLSFCMYKGGDPMEYRSMHNSPPVLRGEMTFEEGDMCVVDLGAAYYGYYSALGAVMPVSQTFTAAQKAAYELTLRIRLEVCKELMTGAPYDHIQLTAERFLIRVLIDEMQLLFGTVEGALESGVGKLLIPHRLVRPLDVGCYGSTHLELGRVYLFETGCDFSKSALDEAFESYPLKYYLRAELRQFEDITVRVSDPVVITVDGFKFLSRMDRESDVIEELRSKDPSVKCPLALQEETNNLKVKPELFKLCDVPV